MSNPDGVLEAIDACLEDVLSEDAMRWAPDEPRSVAWSGGGWPVIRDDAADMLEWSSAITPTQDAIFDAFAGELETPSRDGLLRISTPDSSESYHRVVAVTPGDVPGVYVLSLEPASLPPEVSPREETTGG